MKKFKIRAGINNILPGRVFKMKDNLSSIYAVVYDKVIGRTEKLTSYLYYINFDFKLIKSGPGYIWRSTPEEGFILSKKEFKNFVTSINNVKNENKFKCDFKLKNLHYVEKTITKKTKNGLIKYEILVYPFLNKKDFPSIYDEIINTVKLKEIK